MNQSFEKRKDSLIKEILKSWGEELIEDEGAEKVKQQLRAATPTLRVFITVNVFQERAKYFEACEQYPRMIAALDACKLKLKLQRAETDRFHHNQN